jgi:L-2-hydroxyglutarate oxidase LhgO
VPYANIGKIIVAHDDAERSAVGSYIEKASANGVGELRWLSKSELAEMEPVVNCVAGRHIRFYRHHRQPRTDACTAG